jgi:chromosome segregation ATPase
MCSQSRDEVELVRNELLKAGIAAETRCNTVAKTLGAPSLELWVADGKDSSEASRLYAQMRDGGSGRPGGPTGNGQSAPGPRLIGPGEVDSGKTNRSPVETKRAEVRRTGREDLKQARLLLEKGLEELFRRESELSGACASLRSKVEELNRALVQEQSGLKREFESRSAAERNHAEQIVGMERALERERKEWQQQIQSRDEALKKKQLKVDAVSLLLETQQASVVALKEEIVALGLQREEGERALCQARREALAERQAHVAAEERAAKAGKTQKSLETELIHRKDLEQKMRSHVASLNSLCGQMEKDRRDRDSQKT